jgi:hypothetical protein
MKSTNAQQNGASSAMMKNPAALNVELDKNKENIKAIRIYICKRAAAIQIGVKLSNPRTPKKRDNTPPRIPMPFAKNRIHLQVTIDYRLIRNKETYHGKAAFGSCSCSICAFAVVTDAPILQTRNQQLIH